MLLWTSDLGYRDHPLIHHVTDDFAWSGGGVALAWWPFSVILVNAMTLLDAEEYDPARDRRRRIRIIAFVVILVVLVGLGWYFHNWPEERVALEFFQALQDKNYETAYGIWMHDPDWKQHLPKYKQYPFNDFYRDWGPGGEWGLIKSHRIYGSITPKGSSSGVVVEIIINDRSEHARVWVQKSDKTMSFSPY